MKKRLLSAILTTIMATTLFACGNNIDDTTTVVDNEIELNIIDDNYRNYYEIFVYSFYDSDGDGIGDINGVTQKLDYIEDMGFNGIWLMPIMQSTTYHKYDVVDYYSIDTEYGTIDDFNNLIEECHNRGINVIIDFVINHSSSQNQWFIDACDYLRGLPEGQSPDINECPYIEYYNFADSQIDSTYYQVSGTDYYYEGSFWSEMPDLNLESAALRTEIEDIARFWVEDLGVDGFRMDAAMHFEENNITFNTETLNWLYTFCKGINPDFYMVSEVWASEKTIEEYYQSQTPSMFNFDVSGAEGKIVKAARGTYKAASFVEAMLAYQTDFSSQNPDYIDAPFISNHDMVRVSNNLMSNEDNMKMACGLLMTMNGSPFVYYGEEIGMASSVTKDENKRLPFNWSNTDLTGLTTGPAEADQNITQPFPTAEEQQEDPTSILNYYKRALKLRNQNPEIARGEIQIIEDLTKDNQAVITKTYNNTTIAIIYNTSTEELKIETTGTPLETMEMRGYLTLNNEPTTLEENILTLPPQSICILK